MITILLSVYLDDTLRVLQAVCQQEPPMFALI